MRTNRLKYEFVDFIPKQLESDIIYISIPYATAAHLCCCGCGNEVVTLLSPTDWRVTFDGETVSFHPSIGNWSFDCQSHYWIDRNRVTWARRWAPGEIETGRAKDRAMKNEYYRRKSADEAYVPAPPLTPKARGSLWARLWKRLRSRGQS